MVEIEKFSRRRGASANLGTDAVDPTHHLGIKFNIAPERVVNPLTPLNKPRKNFVYVIDGKRIISAKNFACPFRAGTVTVPDLPSLVALAAKNHKLAMGSPWNQS